MSENLGSGAAGPLYETISTGVERDPSAVMGWLSQRPEWQKYALFLAAGVVAGVAITHHGQAGRSPEAPAYDSTAAVNVLANQLGTDIIKLSQGTSLNSAHIQTNSSDHLGSIVMTGDISPQFAGPSSHYYMVVEGQVKALGQPIDTEHITSITLSEYNGPNDVPQIVSYVFNKDPRSGNWTVIVQPLRTADTTQLNSVPIGGAAVYSTAVPGSLNGARINAIGRGAEQLTQQIESNVPIGQYYQTQATS